MNHTFLTDDTLIRFESKVDINTLTQEQIHDIEHFAYCANMGAKDKDSAFDWFSHLVKKHMNIDLKNK